MARQTNLPNLVQLRLPDDLAKGIDNWRREQDDIPTRSEAIRRLLRNALAGGGRSDD
ncbi:ribbon-helix-helix domain-containing protein [Sphingobium yanoikuyae]|uniref:ribbon-helix-helix domain-containing protein n=1 Tax=Sphingobium yanoikuyae TaxID=13690 RepID=UPI00391F175D